MAENGDVELFDRGGYRPATGRPRSGGTPANGSWDAFTAGPDGTGKAMAERAKELGRARKEAARVVHAEKHQDTTGLMAEIQAAAVKDIHRRMQRKEISAVEASIELKEIGGEKTLDRLIGKPSQHTEATHEISGNHELVGWAEMTVPDDDEALG